MLKVSFTNSIEWRRVCLLVILSVESVHSLLLLFEFCFLNSTVVFTAVFGMESIDADVAMTFSEDGAPSPASVNRRL